MSNSQGFAEVCLQLYKDKMVEVNTGEQKTTLVMADFQCSQKDLIRGILVDATQDAIVLECVIGKERKKIIINCWSIISLAEVGIMKCAYVDEDFRRNRRA